MTAAAITQIERDDKIPCETGVPLLGCLPEMSQDMLGFFRRLGEEHDEIVEFKLLGQRMSLVTSPALCHQILTTQYPAFRKADFDVGILRVILGNGLVTNNSVPTHKVQRKMVQPGFHFRRIESYGKTMIDYTGRMIKDWPESGIRYVSNDMYELTMYIVSKTLFDTDMQILKSSASNVADVVHQFQAIADRRYRRGFQLPQWLPTPGNWQVRKIKQTLHATISTMIEQRTRKDGSYDDRGDLLSMLLQTHYENGEHLSREQLMDELITLFLAGHETTSNALTWTLFLLAKHPEIQQKVHHELDLAIIGDSPEFEDLEALKYTEMVIKESMRMLPPVWTLSCRQANETTELAGYLIPKDKILFISPWANHYNPRFFKEPDRFMPERFSPEAEKQLPRYAYMPFGGGPRVCIGNSFAMMEAKLILAGLLKRFRFELAPNTKLDPQAQITLSNKDGMPLKFLRR